MKRSKGTEHRELDAQLPEEADDLLAEERAVHAHLEARARQRRPHLVHAALDEAGRAVGVVDVSGGGGGRSNTCPVWATVQNSG